MESAKANVSFAHLALHPAARKADMAAESLAIGRAAR
jgi:hypothetical protein